MLLVFVHGWGVQHADYGVLPERLRASFEGDAVEVWLSQYVSYDDNVTLCDLANAFERARAAQFPDRPFVCVTHSTGGPVMRAWLLRHGGPLTNLILLAPPNHGSALAQLGKGRVSRLKCWVEGVQPGQRILDWLELGSEEAWDLNVRWIETDWAARGVSCAVITGATPDVTLYDHLNSYTYESASDGVVRIVSANLNYGLLRLRQESNTLQAISMARSETIPLIAWLGESHSSIRTAQRPPAEGPRQPASMLIFKVIDDAGQRVEDFDLLLTSGPEYSPDGLPRGFFLDRQRNGISRNTLTYFLNYAALHGGELGFVVRARPEDGHIRYAPAEYRGSDWLRPDETTLIEVTLKRIVEDRVFTLSSGTTSSRV